LAKGKLSMPGLAICGEKAFGATMAKIMQFAAINVREGFIPDSGHWITEENPTATISMVRGFLEHFHNMWR
jgi:pimeloyl-ACP methyl ester carboxylesterase